MLSFHIYKLVIVGLCLLVIGRVLQLLNVIVRKIDWLLTQPCLDAVGLTEEVVDMARQRQNLPPAISNNPNALLLQNSAYRWTCRLMRRLNGLENLSQSERRP